MKAKRQALQWIDGSVFGLKYGGTIRGSCFLFLYYDRVNSITRNIQLLYILVCSYWLLGFDIPEIFLERDNYVISLELYQRVYNSNIPSFKCNVFLSTIEC